MSVRIITDTSSEITQEEAKKYNIGVVPMYINFSRDVLKDGIELSKDMFYERMLKDTPKTSQPSPSDFLPFFKDASKMNDDVIAVLLSSALSGTCQSAELAAEMAGCRLYFTDSSTASYAQKILLFEAIKLRDQGKNAEEIAEVLTALKKRVVIYAALDTLEYLYKGGRLNVLEAGLGTLANIKPIITIKEDGTVGVIGKSLGKSKAIKQIQKKVQDAGIDFSYPVYAVYSQDLSNSRELIKKMGLTDVIYANIGATIGTHIGPGAFGLMFVKK